MVATEEPSHWDMKLSQMPRERRPEAALEPVAPLRTRPPSSPPAPAPAPRREAVGEDADENNLEVMVEPVEVHLRRSPDWKRLVAWLVDGVPFVALFAFVLGTALDRLPHAAPLDLATALDLAVGEAAGITAPVFAGTLIIFAVYQALAHGFSGATLGKWLVGIRVVGPTGRRPGFGRAAIRAVLAIASLLLLGLGILLALVTRSGRALHDLLGRTWVVEAP